MTKMTKTLSKFMVAALSTSAVIAPIATSVSCGKTKSDVVFAMRMEDLDFWAPLLKQFTETTGLKVATRITSNQQGDYNTWNRAGNLPDIMLMDQNTAKVALNQKKWFEEIDLKELGQSEYDVVGTPEAFDFQDSSKFFTETFSAFKTESYSTSNKVVGIPYGYGAQGIFINKAKLNAFDPTKKIIARIPKVGTDTDVHAGFDEYETIYPRTEEGIRNFVSSSGKLDDQEFASTETKAEAISKGWVDAGPLALYQRLGSIGADLSKVNETGWVKDLGFPFEVVASLGIDGLIVNGVMNDEVLKTSFPDQGEVADAIYNKLYQSYIGYFTGIKGAGNLNPPAQTAGSPRMLGEPGEGEVFWKGKGATLLGYKWHTGLMRDNWYEGSTSAEKAQNFFNNTIVVPATYGSIGVDALAVKKGLTDQKKANAFKFLRFVFDTTNNSGKSNAYTITGNKVMSPFIDAREMQKTDINNNNSMSEGEKSINKAFFDAYVGSATVNGISGAIIASSTAGIYDIFNGKIGKALGDWATANATRPWTLPRLKTNLRSGIDSAWQEIAIIE